MDTKFIEIRTTGNFNVHLNVFLIEYIRGNYLDDKRTLIRMNSGQQYETLTNVEKILELIKST